MSLGILLGAYLLIVCVTGAALVFRIDMQRALHPHLFTAGTDRLVDAATVIERVRDNYPGWRVSGVEAPTTARPTYLAYVVREQAFRTLLVDASGGHVLGELPETSFIRTLQDLHFDLLAGHTGRQVSGVGALLLLALCLTGIVVWWPARGGLRRAWIARGRGWKRVIRDLHGAAGIWSAALIAMWAVTGLSFAFPSQFRATINWISPLTVATAPPSNAAAAVGPRPAWHDLIAAAQRHVADQHVARVILPAAPIDPVRVAFSPAAPTPVGAPLTEVVLDQYTGALLARSPAGTRRIGDTIMAWVVPLHVGNFGGAPSKVAWAVAGLTPPLLALTGLMMWWVRTRAT